MARLNDVFPTKYLTAGDLPNRDCPVMIESARVETLGQGADASTKIVLRLRGKQKELVLNRTNANVVAGIHGNETDDWAGKWIAIYPTEVQYGGRMVPAIRVRLRAPEPPAARPASQTAPPPPPPPADDAGDDHDEDIPF